jgi:hypothetical protein
MRTRIKTIEAKTYQGKVTGYAITLENGVTGYLDDKNSDKQLGFGEEVDYTVSVKQNKTTKKDYNLLVIKRSVSETQQKEVVTETKPETATTLPSSPLTPTGMQEVRKLKAEASVRLMIKAMDMFNEEKLDWDALAEKQKYVTQLVWGEIDEIYGLG